MRKHGTLFAVFLCVFTIDAMAQHATSVGIDPVAITPETKVAKELGKTGSRRELVAYETPSSIPGPSLTGLGMQENGLIEPVSILPQSRFYREYQGGIWAETPLRWSPDRRYAIFENPEKLAIVDTQASVVLLNSAFTAFSKSPVEDRWVAIRYRPSGRNQEMLIGNEMDTVWFIEPADLAAKAQMASDAHPFAHVPAVQIDGIAVASPHWSKDGTSVAIVRQRDGILVADVFDPFRNALICTVPMQDMALTQEQLLSVWIIPEIDRRVSEAIKDNHIFKTDRQ